MNLDPWATLYFSGIANMVVYVSIKWLSDLELNTDNFYGLYLVLPPL